MTNHKVIPKIGDYTFESFNITYRTPQGSLLSSILLALYTTNLLNTIKRWKHSDLTMYINDGAIYTTFHMINTAAMKARDHFHKVLEWLYQNSLDADLAKTKLMTFKKQSANQNLLGNMTQGLRYINLIHSLSNITAACSDT